MKAIIDYLKFFFLEEVQYRIVERGNGMFYGQRRFPYSGWTDLDGATMFQSEAMKQIERDKEIDRIREEAKTIKRIIKV